MAAGKKQPTPADRLQQLRQEVPATLAAFSRQARQGLARLELQIADGGQHSRRLSKQLVQILRDVSHQLGHYEAHGERGWRALTLQARAESAKMLQKLEKAIAPPKPKAKPKARRKAASTPRKKSTSTSRNTRKAS